MILTHVWTSVLFSLIHTSRSSCTSFPDIVHIAFHTLYVMYAILSGYYKSKESCYLKPLTFWCILPYIAFTYISFHSHYWTSKIT